MLEGIQNTMRLLLQLYQRRKEVVEQRILFVCRYHYNTDQLYLEAHCVAALAKLRV